MIAAVLAASLSFTATATGIEKGAPVEFIFAGRNTDRDYETMFLIDDSVDELCTKLEAAGLPRGRPTDAAQAHLWPVGCRIEFTPAIDSFIERKNPEGLIESHPIYTGGLRLQEGVSDAGTNMPAAVFSTYTLAQSPFVYNGIYDQGAVYGSFTARKALKKGERISFTVSWDAATFPKEVGLTIHPGKATEVLNALRAASEKSEISARIGFDGRLTVQEATAASQALATIDSSRIKINGYSNIFYRAFLPLVKWRDRKERLVQPFELTLGTTNRLVFIEEDWTVEGADPKLTPIEIDASDAVRHPKTDTCFIYTNTQTPIFQILRAMESLKGVNVRNWYVFSGQ